MPETDSLSDFDFNKVSKPGKFLKFEAGKPVTVRILTKDPVIQEKEFTKGSESNVSLKFCFIVWNFTTEMAQILSATPKMAKTFQNIAKDEDFGSNLQKCDIKISPEGEMLERVYDINVVRHSGNEKELTREMIGEAQKIDLDRDIQDNRGRLSAWQVEAKKSTSFKEDIETAKEVMGGNEDSFDDQPINLDDIPF